MLKLFRNVAHGELSGRSTLFDRVCAGALRLFTLAVMMICLMDAINVDVIYAAVSGDIRYQDNPAIVDSQFDSGLLRIDVPCSFEQHCASDRACGCESHESLRSSMKFLGTVIYEDIDSPTVLDGTTTTTLIYDLLPEVRYPEVRSERTVATFDRTISFLPLLI